MFPFSVFFLKLKHDIVENAYLVNSHFNMFFDEILVFSIYKKMFMLILAAEKSVIFIFMQFKKIINT